MVVDEGKKTLIESTNTIIAEIMRSLFKESALISSVSCMNALYTFIAVSGNSDNLLSISEQMKDLSSELELLSRVYAFLECETPAFNKIKALEEFNNFLHSRTEHDKILYVENVNGEIKFTALASLPAAPQQKNPYGYFAL
ncbi:MAG: hypothetical protein ACMV0I_08615 [Pseudomonas sp.]